MCLSHQYADSANCRLVCTCELPFAVTSVTLHLSTRQMPNSTQTTASPQISVYLTHEHIFLMDVLILYLEQKKHTCALKLFSRALSIFSSLGRLPRRSTRPLTLEGSQVLCNRGGKQPFERLPTNSTPALALFSSPYGPTTN